MRKSRVGQPLKVIWDDAWHSDGYITVEEALETTPHQVVTYGLCVRDDAKAVVLAMDAVVREGPNGRRRDFKYIPRGMVREVKVLR